MFGSNMYTNIRSFEVIYVEIFIEKFLKRGVAIMKAQGISFKKIALSSMIFFVSVLVLFAFYSSKDKFTGFDTIKYMQIQLSNETNVTQVAEKYTEPENIDRFIAEVKRINGLQSSGFSDKTNLIIPVFGTN